jgi:uncharacterized membrane protein YraQ (UPF0718 family)
VAGPILNVVVILSTYVAFGGLNATSRMTALEMVALRCGLGFLVAVVTGCVVHFLQKKHGAHGLLTAVAAPPPVRGGLSLGLVDAPEPAKPRKPLLTRLGNISQTTLHDFMDITVFLIIGATLAAVAKLYIDPNQITQLSREQPYLAIPLMMALAVVMCLCSEADAFVAASFTEMSASSKLAFLVLGPMLDLKLLLMYTRVFRPRLIAVLVACTVSQVMLYTMLLHGVYDPNPAATAGASAPPAVAPSAVTTPPTTP